MQQPVAPTPSSILKKRANKENDAKEAKRNRLRGRRVSFAPDDELETMHLYQKDKGQHEDVTDDLSARMPLALQELNLPSQPTHSSMSSQQQPGLLSMMSPGAMMSPMSMDLTNNSDLLQRAASVQPGVVPSLPAFDFTCNITSAVPALSTLVEEDEDSMHGVSQVMSTPLQDHSTAQQQHDVTVSMELTGAVSTPQHIAGDNDLSPVRQPLQQQQPLGGGLDMTPTSPFALQALGTGAPDAGELQDKWGFAPGVDDTLDVSHHGRKVMGDTTYNHVYGSSTMGDITLAMKGDTGAVGNTRLALANRFPAAGDAGGEAGLLGGSTGNGQACQQEMTINLLAEDQPAGMWRQPFAARPAAPGHVAVAGSVLPGHHAADELAGGDFNATAGLLAGSLSMAAAPAGLLAGGGPANATRTVNNFTAQLLAEGTATAGPLGSFMQRVQEASRGPAADPLPAAHLLTRDDETLLSSTVKPSGLDASLAMDVTAASLEFNLATAAAPPVLFGEHTLDTLDDFAKPPDLPLTGSTPGGAATQMGSLSQRQAAVAAAAALPLPPASPELHTTRGMDSQADSMQLVSPSSGVFSAALLSQLGVAPAAPAAQPGPAPPAAQPQVAPISFQEFLGLVEIRFLDDMRRRTSFMPAYDVSLLGGGPLARAPRDAPLQYSEALEVVHVSGVLGALQKAHVHELADRVEALQRHATQGEVALARNNPPLFQDVQVCGPDVLEDLRDRMKLLKRVCRQRTLLSWKKGRIAQEQALSGAYRNAMTSLDAQAATLQAAHEQVLALERSLDEAQLDASQQTQQLQEQTKSLQVAREHDTQMVLRVDEISAANQARRSQLEALVQQQADIQSEYESALQQRASLSQQVQVLQGQGISRSPATQPTGGSSTAAQDTLDQRLTSLQATLDTLLTAQGLQLDLRQPPSGPRHTWSVIVEGQFRLSVLGSGAADQQQPDSWSAAVEPTSRAAPLARDLLAACVGSTWEGLTSSQVLSHVRHVIASLRHLIQHVCQLEAALLTSKHLTTILLAPAADTLDAAAPQLLLNFVSVGTAQQQPWKVQLGIACGPQLLAQPQQHLPSSAIQPKVHLPVRGRQELCNKLTVALGKHASSPAAGLPGGSWQGLCQLVVQVMQEGVQAAPIALAGAVTATCAGEQAAAEAGVQAAHGPVIVDNPL